MKKEINFLFWNVNKQEYFLPYLKGLVEHYKVDVLVLIENNSSTEKIAPYLDFGGSIHFRCIQNLAVNHSIEVFTQVDELSLVYQDADIKLQGYKLQLSSDYFFLIFVVHLPSLLNRTENTLNTIRRKFARFIQEKERELKTQNTIVLGDFNMNPFDEVMIGIDGFHAVMDRNTAKRQTKTVHFAQYDYFYNPMWSKFGDLTDGPPGTYFYSQSDMQWQMFDQVLIRPTLIDNFVAERLKIIDNDGSGNSFLKNGVIDKTISDHLPVFFQLSFDL